MKSPSHAVNVNSQAALTGVEQPSHASQRLLQRASECFPVRPRHEVSQWRTLGSALLPSPFAALPKQDATFSSKTSKFTSGSFFFPVSVREPFILYWCYICNIIFLWMRRASCIIPVKSTSFTLSYYTDVLFHEILMLSLPWFCVRKTSISKKKEARQEQVQQFAWGNLWVLAVE